MTRILGQSSLLLLIIGVVACGSDAASSTSAGAEPSSGAAKAENGGAGGDAVGSGGRVAGSGGALLGGGGTGPMGAGGGSQPIGAGGGTEPVGTGGTEPVGTGGGTATDCDTAQSLSQGDHDFTIVSANGLTYRYTLVVPASVVPGRKAPLALLWHALWSSPEETRSLTHVDRTMADLGIISVHPRSPDASWDVGSCCTGIVLGRRRDETVFVKELLKDVESKVCVDQHRVYASGFSNGGMISQMLACKMSDVFAAAAPMGSTLTIPATDCHPSRPMPIFMINGTADPLVGYAAPGLAGGVSVPDAFKTWADREGCTGEPKTTIQKGKATCRTYDQCTGGAEVTLCSVEGMGHCVPGMKTESPMNCLTKNLIPLGMPNDDVDGVDLSAEFLTKYTLP